MHLTSVGLFFTIIKQGGKSKGSDSVIVCASMTCKWIVKFD